MHKIKEKNLTDKFKNVVNEKEALDIILRDNRNLKFLPDKFKKDRKFILGIIKQGHFVLEYLESSFKKDLEESQCKAGEKKF